MLNTEKLFTDLLFRDQYKSDYEEKLKRQLEDLRIRNDVEIDRLKTSTRELYERENRLGVAFLIRFVRDSDMNLQLTYDFSVTSLSIS